MEKLVDYCFIFSGRVRFAVEGGVRVVLAEDGYTDTGLSRHVSSSSLFCCLAFSRLNHLGLGDGLGGCWEGTRQS